MDNNESTLKTGIPAGQTANSGVSAGQASGAGTGNRTPDLFITSVGVTYATPGLVGRPDQQERRSCGTASHLPRGLVTGW